MELRHFRDDDNRIARRDIPGETPSRDRVIDAEVVEMTNTEALEAEIEAITAAMAEAEAERKREVNDLKARVKEWKSKASKASRDAFEQAQNELTEQERALAKKEADAWAQPNLVRLPISGSSGSRSAVW